MTRPRVIAVCGMQSEMRIAAGSGVQPICAGAQAELLKRRLAAELGEAQVVGLVSFGIAGGLDPKLAPGALLIGEWVGDATSRWPVDEAWRDALAHACPGAVSAGVLGGDAISATAAMKHALSNESGAAVVDTESHIVAEMARDAGLPFAVIRSVADPANASLPPAALIGLRPDGRPDIGRVLASVARDPGQIPALLQTARYAGTALASLRRFRRNLGPGLGCPHLVELMLDVP